MPPPWSPPPPLTPPPLTPPQGQMTMLDPSPLDLSPPATIALNTCPGDGMLTRRSRALLFVPCPTGNADALTTAFDRADPGTEMTVLADTVVAHQFDVAAFVCVTFDESITVRVFGDLTITSDAPSLPRLSARGAETWIDHTLGSFPTSEPFHISTVPDSDRGKDAAAGHSPATNSGIETNLEVGRVHAGGFTLRLPGSGLGAPPDEGAAPLREASPLPPPPPVPTTEEPTINPVELHPEQRSAVPGSLDAAGLLRAAGDDLPAVELHFEDGRRLPLDGEVVVGRNPMAVSIERKAIAWQIEDERISRAHLSMTLRDGQTFVEDLSSRNGTLYLAPGSTAPLPLAPGRRTALDVGTLVFLGSTNFIVVAAQ